MGNYTDTMTLWKHLGKDAYTKVRAEIVGTGNATTSAWDLDHDNVISSSETLYTDGSSVTSSAYSIDLDDGKITGLTAGSGVTLSADYDYGDAPDSIMQDLISHAEKELEHKTGRNFVQNTGEIEYLDVESEDDVFFVSNYPVITFSSVECNKASSEADTPSWSSSTEGLGNDYLANSKDRELGRIRYINNKPIKGLDRLKITYNWGYTSTPELIEELTILLAQTEMINSAIYKSIFKGQDNFTPIRLEELEARIKELINLFKKQNIELA